MLREYTQEVGSGIVDFVEEGEAGRYTPMPWPLETGAPGTERMAELKKQNNLCPWHVSNHVSHKKGVCPGSQPSVDTWWCGVGREVDA